MVVLLLQFDVEDGIKWHLLIERRVNFCRSFANIIPVYYVCFWLKFSLEVCSLESYSQNLTDFSRRTLQLLSSFKRS